MTADFKVSGEAITYHDNSSCDSLTVLTQDNSGDHSGDIKLAPELATSPRPTKLSSTSKRLHVIILAISVLFIALLVSTSYASDLTLTSLWSTTSSRRQCQDPYLMPGYLLHNTSASKARWIPYTDDVLHSTITPAVLPANRDETVVEAEMLEMAPPSYASMLEKGAEDSLELYAAELEPLRNKSVLILGCSLDRFFMESICPRLGAPFLNVMDDWHGIFRCTIPSINLDIQLWFTYGALPEHKTSEESGRINIFEDRIRDHWLPAAERLNLNTEPDMILWASGTWDVLGLRTKFREQDKKAWKEQAMSFQELAWHRMRLNEMMSFIRNQWPGVPTMYRPPTYTYKKDLPSWNGQLEGVTYADIDQINEGVWRLTQSAAAVMKANDMPIFAWGEKLIGNGQYSDTTHFTKDSYAQWLYAEMLLYYVHYYSTPNPSHCIVD